jgi:hypothetical protein
MKKAKILNRGVLFGSLSLLTGVAILIAQTYMVFSATQKVGGDDDGKLPGSVGLRNYFDSGTGTEVDPFVITRPVHLYNLSRLQSLGAFPTLKYFRLGKEMDSASEGLEFYTDDSATTTTKVLDMSGYATKFVSIGSTATPFFGIFNGSDLTVNNLTVTSDPEDIGVFGYVASGAQITNTRFANLTIKDNGYSTFLSTLYTTDYSAITPVSFNSALITTTAATFKENDSASLGTGVTLDGKTFTLSATGFPTTVDGLTVTYGIRATNNTLLIPSNDGQSISIARSALSNSTTFNSATSNYFRARIYVTGTVTKNNIKYAKIMATYLLTFINNGSSNYSLMAVRDTEGNTGTGYHHKTNIGLIVGHCDGKLSSDYVYNGTFQLNSNADSTFVNQEAESDMGLVGEVGVNVDNDISPSQSYEDAGDTGIINFTSIYANVVDTATVTFTHVTDYTSGGTNYPYYYFTTKTGNMYDASSGNYLRRRQLDASNYQYITAYENSVDFKGRQLVVEDDTKSRGLGIFQINTTDVDNSDEVANFPIGMGQMYIQHDTATADLFSNVFYSTAEYDQSYFGSTNITNWKPGSTNGAYRINMGTTIPGTSGTASPFTSGNASLLSSKLFERNNDYLIKFDLMDLTNYYFSSTPSSFIKDYFTYKLRDKKGETIDSTASDFGIMIKEKNSTSTTPVNTTQFSSYLKLTPYSSNVPETMSIDSTAYPTKTIQFTIDNAYGANITLVARSTSDSGNYIGVYPYTSSTLSSINIQQPTYAMYVPSNTTTDTSEAAIPAYFNYNYDSNAKTYSLDTNATIPTTGTTEDRLYAHTFYLPAGTYFIASPVDNAYIYYIAVQGQTNADIGGQSIVFADADTIKDLDFLLYDPTATGFVFDSTRHRAYATINGYWDASAKAGGYSFNVTAGDESITIGGVPTSTRVLKVTSSSNLTKAMIYNQLKKYVSYQWPGSTATIGSEKYIKYNWPD